MPTLETILNAIRKELQHKDKLREESQKDMRQATSLSKQAILLTHQGKLKEAETKIADAKKTLSKLRQTSVNHPDIIYGGMFNAAMEEYSEANIFLKLVKESSFLTPNEIDVSPEEYVLGLGDAIGECRRLTLDSLRRGNLKKAESCLQIMDEIYIQLMAMDDSYMLISGLRRKCDVARKIIEITRGDVTQEIRRNMLEKQLKQLEKQLKTKGTPRKKPRMRP